MLRKPSQASNKRSSNHLFSIRNTDRSVGPRLSGPLPKPMVKVVYPNFTYGYCWPKFGVWNKGVELTLVVMPMIMLKGMAVDALLFPPPVGSAFKAHRPRLWKYLFIYGATGGKLYASGWVNVCSQKLWRHCGD